MKKFILIFFLIVITFNIVSCTSVNESSNLKESLDKIVYDENKIYVDIYPGNFGNITIDNKK